MRGGARKGVGGPQPGSGPKPSPFPKKQVNIKLTEAQHTMMKTLGGSPWLQGLLNLEIARQATTPHP